MYADGGAHLVEHLAARQADGCHHLARLCASRPLVGRRARRLSPSPSAALPYVDVFMPSAEEIHMLRRRTYDELEVAAEGGRYILPLPPPVAVRRAGELLAMDTAWSVSSSAIAGCTCARQRKRLSGTWPAWPADAATGRTEMWSACFRLTGGTVDRAMPPLPLSPCCAAARGGGYSRRAVGAAMWRRPTAERHPSLAGDYGARRFCWQRHPRTPRPAGA
jgi:hypothetical protein